jgi:hypothetical protein
VARHAVGADSEHKGASLGELRAAIPKRAGFDSAARRVVLGIESRGPPACHAAPKAAAARRGSVCSSKSGAFWPSSTHSLMRLPPWRRSVQRRLRSALEAVLFAARSEGGACDETTERIPTHRLRHQLHDLLASPHAHATLEQAVAGVPPHLRGAKPPGQPHTLWRLLEHLRIAQWGHPRVLAARGARVPQVARGLLAGRRRASRRRRLGPLGSRAFQADPRRLRRARRRRGS